LPTVIFWKGPIFQSCHWPPKGSCVGSAGITAFGPSPKIFYFITRTA